MKWAKESTKFAIPAKLVESQIYTRTASKLVKTAHLFTDSPNCSVTVQPQYLWNLQVYAKPFT